MAAYIKGKCSLLDYIGTDYKVSQRLFNILIVKVHIDTIDLIIYHHDISAFHGVGPAVNDEYIALRRAVIDYCHKTR